MPDIDVRLCLWLVVDPGCASSRAMQVSVYLPPLRRLKGIVDRMKSLSSHVVSGLVE